jgi:hypothetical protein
MQVGYHLSSKELDPIGMVRCAARMDVALADTEAAAQAPISSHRRGERR